MAMQSARQYMTFEQYLLLVNNSDRHYEYYDGEVRLMAGGTSNHATIALNYTSVLNVVFLALAAILVVRAWRTGVGEMVAMMA